MSPIGAVALRTQRRGLLVLTTRRRIFELTPSSAAEGLSEADLVRFGAKIFPNERTYRLFLNEARFGLSRVLQLLSSFDRESVQILEVGAGSCLLSAYLASKKLQVTAVEPLGPEFDFFVEPQRRVLEFCRTNGISVKIIRTTGETMDLPGQFDVAFTINALEHMHDPLRTIGNICDSLKPGGLALVHCPNYTIPFEVHFNILLVSRSKPINEWLYRSKISRYPEVWRELNFIRQVDVRRYLAARRANFTFQRSVMRDLVARLLNDPLFAERMPALVRTIGRILQYSGLLNALTFVPPRFQTPMEVWIKQT
jgi:SAM-dependent methyltransferase